MISKIPGKGANYMVAWTDGAGDLLSGGESYRLKLPPNIPAANFWSVTLYEAENFSGLAMANLSRRSAHATGRRRKRTVPRSSISDRPRRRARRATGSPRTLPGKGYFAILRLYSPTEAAFDKSWKPGDIEKVD